MKDRNAKPKAAEVKKALKEMFEVDDAVDMFTDIFYSMKENSGSFETADAKKLGAALDVLRKYAGK